MRDGVLQLRGHLRDLPVVQLLGLRIRPAVAGELLGRSGDRGLDKQQQGLGLSRAHGATDPAAHAHPGVGVHGGLVPAGHG